MLSKISDLSTVTIQTRAAIDEDLDQILSLFATLMGRVERSLFADLRKGRLANECKSSYLKQYEITARHFNSLRVQLEGKISSARECQKNNIQNLKLQISALDHFLKKKASRSNPKAVQQKRRRLFRLEAKLKRLEEDVAQNRVRLCFGSRRRFRAQYYLEANGYRDHKEWREDWMASRTNNIFLLGSKDETSGNQSATTTIQEDGNLSLRIRLPDALREHGKYLVIKDLHFSYGHELIVAALRSDLPVAITYRLVRDKKGWTILASFSVQRPPIISRKELGVIGVDLNSEHVAVIETDRYGNPIQHARLSLNTYGKSQNQAKALMGETAKELVDWALKAQKPIVMERLSFAEKKAELREMNHPRYARMLSSFAYNGIGVAIRSRASRYGVEVREVNPAYTSIIGRVKFCKRYGLSTHGSAALCIGRRLLGASESLPRHLDHVADGKGGYLVMRLPVRNRGMHVWSLWRQIKKKLPAALAAHFRAKIDPGNRSNPVLCDTRRVLDVVGANPAREPTAELLGCRI